MYFKKIKIICIIMLISFCACNQSKPQPELKPIPVPTAAEGIKVDIKTLASVNDTSCGMSLTDGVGDTATVNGKLYGFCSKGCKESFLALQTKK